MAATTDLSETKLMIEHLKSPNLVKFYVGTSREVLFVHEELLFARIDYFRAAFKGKFKEGEEKEISLPEDDVLPFAEVINWVYGGKMVCKYSECKGKHLEDFGKRSLGHFIPLFAVWILADKYGIKELESECLQACQNCIQSTGWWKMDDEELKYIYANGGRGSSLRLWAADLVVQHFFRGRPDEDDLNLEQPFNLWKDVRRSLIANNDEYQRDWEAAIRNHFNEVGLNKCEITRCVYHDVLKFGDFI